LTALKRLCQYPAIEARHTATGDKTVVTKNAFSSKFGKKVAVGDEIKAEIGGLTVVAKLEADYVHRPHDFGFDPEDPDYAGENKRICESWKRGRWFYVGVVLSVSKCGIVLDEYAVSLWGIEANFPGSDNSYLTEVANELLPEAIERAQDILKTLCAA
jgi:hypothetical protein